MRSPKILIVDDDEMTLELTRLTLAGCGFETVTLANPHRMVPAIRDEKPDLILLDVFMPGLRGDQVVQILKRHRFSRHVPILLYSDNDEAALRSLVRETGADGYVCKSFDEGVLDRQIRTALAAASAPEPARGLP